MEDSALITTVGLIPELQLPLLSCISLQILSQWCSHQLQMAFFLLGEALFHLFHSFT